MRSVLLAQQVIPQLAFLSPERLLILLIIPALVLAYIFASLRKNRRGMRFTNTSMLDVVVPKQSQWRRHPGGRTLTLEPDHPHGRLRPAEDRSTPERATVVMVIDASLSMQATDVKPTRLDAAKQAAIDFVMKLPEKYNVSVVSMAGAAAILVPQPPLIARWKTRSTAFSCRNRQRSARASPPRFGLCSRLRRTRTTRTQLPRAPLCCSATARTRPAARRCKPRRRAAKVPIYTIAYGTENGYVDLDGKREPVPVDHEEMKQIAAATNAEYFAAASADQLKRCTRTSDPTSATRRPTASDCPLCWLRPRAGCACRLGCHLARSKMAVMDLIPHLVPKVVGNGGKSGQIRVVRDHFSKNGCRR